MKHMPLTGVCHASLKVLNRVNNGSWLLTQEPA